MEPQIVGDLYTHIVCIGWFVATSSQDWPFERRGVQQSPLFLTWHRELVVDVEDSDEKGRFAERFTRASGKPSWPIAMLEVYGSPGEAIRGPHTRDIR